jgi:hypothetical protein
MRSCGGTSYFVVRCQRVTPTKTVSRIATMDLFRLRAQSETAAMRGLSTQLFPEHIGVSQSASTTMEPYPGGYFSGI